MKNFIVRALTGAIYVVLLAGCTLYGPVSAYLFFAVVTMATLWEFSTLMNRHYGASLVPYLNAFAGMLLTSSVWLWLVGGSGTREAFALYGLLLFYLLVSELYRKAADPLKNWSLIFASQLYVALPFALLPMMSVVYDENGRCVYEEIYPMALFLFIWVNDTGAYLFGCSLRKYFTAKLFPRISPNKSWVGSIGGGLLTVAAAVTVSHFFPGLLSLPKWIGFALVVVLFGTWGDLVESMLKRQLGIKDSGNVLPGHGGMLDRFDSSLLAIPAVTIYMLLVNS